MEPYLAMIGRTTQILIVFPPEMTSFNNEKPHTLFEYAHHRINIY